MDNKNRVLYFVPSLETGGTEKIILELCRLLDKERFEAEVCTFFPGSFADELRHYVRRLHVIVDEDEAGASRHPAAKALRFWRRVRRVRDILEGSRIAILHTHHLGPLLHAFFAVRGANPPPRWIHTEHNRPDMESFYRSRLRRCLNPLRGPDAVTGVSEAVIDFYRDEAGIAPSRCHAILNGVDVDLFVRAVLERQKTRSSLGIAPQELVVGSVGNLRPEKNHQLLLRAFALLPDRPARRLVLCGNGPCRKDLESLAEELGIADRTLFLGHRLDVPAVISCFDVFCLPSRFEGMPLSVLEAWAAGRPVVGTDVIGIRELLGEGGGGILVPPEQPAEMALALERSFAGGEWGQRIAGPGIALVRERYSISSMTRRYEALYQATGG